MYWKQKNSWKSTQRERYCNIVLLIWAQSALVECTVEKLTAVGEGHLLLSLQAEIDGRHAHYLALKEHGEGLLAKNHYASVDVQRMLGQLDQAWYKLNENWEDRKQLLTQSYDLQVSDPFNAIF